MMSRLHRYFAVGEKFSFDKGRIEVTVRAKHQFYSCLNLRVANGPQFSERPTIELVNVIVGKVTEIDPGRIKMTMNKRPTNKAQLTIFMSDDVILDKPRKVEKNEI